MDSVIHHNHRQQPIISDEACRGYRASLGRLEEMIAAEEDVVGGFRTRSDIGK